MIWFAFKNTIHVKQKRKRKLIRKDVDQKSVTRDKISITVMCDVKSWSYIHFSPAGAGAADAADASSEILVHVDMTAPHSCSRFVDAVCSRN